MVPIASRRADYAAAAPCSRAAVQDPGSDMRSSKVGRSIASRSRPSSHRLRWCRAPCRGDPAMSRMCSVELTDISFET